MKRPITNGDPLPCHNCKTNQYLYSSHCFGASVGCSKCHITADSVPGLLSNDPRADDWEQNNAVDAWNLKMKELQGENTV